MDLMPSKKPIILYICLRPEGHFVNSKLFDRRSQSHSLATIWYYLAYSVQVSWKKDTDLNHQTLANKVMPTSSSLPWEVGVLCEGTLLFDARNADGATPWKDAAQRIVVAMRGEEDGWHFGTYLDTFGHILEFFGDISTYVDIFKQASACQPPTREICCIGPGIVDSWEKELYIMLDIMYIYIYTYI